MKTHVIVQSLSVCLLLAWTVWDIPATDAGGPPIRLAVQTTAPQVADSSSDGFEEATRLVPTEVGSPAQLIPTEIDDQQIQWISDADSLALEFLDFSHEPAFYSPGAPSAYFYFLGRFLDQQLSRNPCRTIRVGSADDIKSAFVPWLDDAHPTDELLGIQWLNRRTNLAQEIANLMNSKKRKLIQ